MYKTISLISAIIRFLYIPNPFETCQMGLLLNLLVAPFLHVITYKIVGIYYERYSCPSLGCFLYLLFYCIHTFILWLLSLAGFSWLLVILILVTYALILKGLLKLKEFISYYLM